MQSSNIYTRIIRLADVEIIIIYLSITLILQVLLKTFPSKKTLHHIPISLNILIKVVLLFFIQINSYYTSMITLASSQKKKKSHNLLTPRITFRLKRTSGTPFVALATIQKFMSR